MNPSLFFDNLVAWSAQVAVLTVTGALVSWNWGHARSRLLFWQGILAITLLLPVFIPWREPPVEAIPSDAAGVVTTTTQILEIARRPTLFRVEVLLAILAIGAVVRLLWIALGLLRLRQMRKDGQPIEGPGAVRWYQSANVTGPVTFGLLRPSVLLPERISQLPAAARDAIVCHEMLHVERRDWLMVLAEEAVRAALWFHPAVWFTLAKIQLAREQAVDEEVVRRTMNREAYVDALLSVAAHRLEPDVAPAPLFLKKRQLAVRVAAVVKESSMSTFRIALRSISASTAALAGAALAVWLFPLQSQAQYAPDEPGITVDAGGKLLHRGPLAFPKGAASGGLVIIDAALNRSGEVSDAHVVSGPEELRRQSLASVLGWHYSDEGGAPAGVRISIQYGSRTSSAGAAPNPPLVNRTGRVRNVEGWNGVVSAIEFSGLSPDLKQRLENRLPVRVGETLSSADTQKIVSAIREIDEHVVPGFQVNPSTNRVTIRLALGAPIAAAPPPPPPPPASTQAATSGSGTKRLRVSGNMIAPTIVEKVNPAYPPLAKAAKVQGIVNLQVGIGTDGHVVEVQPVSGPPLLIEAASDAVKQWVFQPAQLNGAPVEVEAKIEVNFRLAE